MLRRTVLACTLGLALLFTSSAALAQYTMTRLVTNNQKTANPSDALLINAWGLTKGPGLPFWVSDNGSGWSTLYSGTGAKVPLNVTIPAANNDNTGSPTGIVLNSSPQFAITDGNPALFIWATLDGTISGWNPNVNVQKAVIKVNRSGDQASYTALAITNNSNGPNFIYAADNAHDRVDMFNGDFQRVASFTDNNLPANLSVFGIRDLNGLLYVAFADVNGNAGGAVDIFSEQGVFLKHLVEGEPLNQPWGFAAAPSGFGPLSNTLLVSNNTNTGTIIAFNAISGAFVGTVKDRNGNPIEIDQLWAIDFGGGDKDNINGAPNQLFFTAGPDNNADGLFGVITLNQ
jgi:uncharacterized protein (TIGR03118 family)